jgi:hypothetical protein
MSHKAIADGLTAHFGWAAMSLKMNFTEPATFGFYRFQRADGSRLVPDGALPFFRGSIVEMWF